MRLIDADALFFDLDGMMAVSPTGYIHGDTVADMISDAPTIEPEQHWIPCSERWPDDDGVYLVTHKGVTKVALFAWGGWTIGTEDGMGQALPDAWMQLPDPYEGE